MARAIGRVLARDHRTVVVAGGVAVALELFQARIAASWIGVIIDVGLPDGCGLELARTLLALVPGLPVLVITGADTRAAANAAVEAGAQFAFKPLTRKTLQAFVGDALASRRRGRLDAVLARLRRARDLGDRETELVELAVYGVSRADLAARLCVTENTVKSQVRSVLVKCDAATLDELVQRVLRSALAWD